MNLELLSLVGAWRRLSYREWIAMISAGGVAMMALVGTSLVSGCVVAERPHRAHAVVVAGPPPPPAVVVAAPVAPVIVVREAPPPPPREVVIERERPSAVHVWIAGHWRHDGRAYFWVPGHWERPPRPRAVWVEPRWERRDGGYIYIEGVWR